MERKTANTEHIQVTLDKFGWDPIDIRHCSHNCKLTYLSGASRVYQATTTTEKRKAFLDEILRECRIAVCLNTPLVNFKNWLEETYEFYSCSEIPIGYDRNGYGKYQYHIILRNSNGQPNACMRPTEYVKNKKDEDKKPNS